MKILITGGAGFIGSHLAALFADEAEVRVLDDLSSGRIVNLDRISVDFRGGSILDAQALEAAMEGIDYVFHLAAMVSVAESMVSPETCVQMNTLGTLNVLNAAAAARVKKLVLASSCAVYGPHGAAPALETLIPAPLSPYAVTKLDGEYYCAMFTREGRLPTASLRLFNVFGPRQAPTSAYAAAIPAFILRALRGESLVIHGDGEQTRDFIHVRDVVSALRFIAMHSAATGVFNCGYGRSISINELAREILRLTSSSAPLVHSAPRPGDIRHSRASADRLRELGWAPATGWTDGLAETVTSFRPRGQ